MFNSFELGGETEQISRIQAILLGRSQAELVLVERVLVELFAGLERYRQGRIRYTHVAIANDFLAICS